MFAAFCSAQIITSSYYAGKIYPGVKVAGLDIGGLSRVDAKKRLEEKIEGFKVNLQVDQKTYTASTEQAGVNYSINATLDDAFLTGRNHWFVPYGVIVTGNKDELNYSFEIDKSKQDEFINRIVTETGRPAVDATVVIDNGEPKVQSDVNGVGLSTAQVEKAIVEQIATVDQSTVSLEQTSQPARIKAADVEPAVNKTKQLLAIPVTVTFQGKIFRPTPSEMSNWYLFEKTAPTDPAGVVPKPSLDGIKNYLQKVAIQINVNPINKKVKVENGVSAVEREGAEGLALNQDLLAGQIAAAVAEGKAFTGEAPTNKLSFKTETNHITTLAYGKYIEINLSRQRMWVYQDQKVIYESPITSGAAGAGFPTVQGLFSVLAKQTNRNLNGYAIGYNYNVFVQYWMPFYGNYGLHDASWRSAFGGSDYYYGGSHGCVNMPLAAAAFLFGWADVGTPVWVHS